MVWQAALWATMKKYKISTNLIQVIKNLYNQATNAVLFNSSIVDWFRTTAGVRQECLLSPTLFSIFLERIMRAASADHEGTASIGGRTINNLRLADAAGVVCRYLGLLSTDPHVIGCGGFVETLS